MRPTMCGETELKIPDVNCDCEDFAERISDLEDRADITDGTLETLSECCDSVNTTIGTHGTSINNINSEITLINDKISSLSGLKTVKVNVLPQVGEANTIYIVEDAQGNSVMWMYIENEWESVGNTSVDLSEYATKQEVTNGLKEVFPVGSVIITSTPDAPTKYAGKWELVKKGFKSRTLVDTGVTWSTKVAREGSLIIVKENSIQIRLRWLSKTDMITENRLMICSIPYSSLGLAAMYDMHLLSYSDGDNAIAMIAAAQNSANQRYEISSVDGIRHGNNVWTGNVWELCFDLMFIENQMRNEYCDKFYWKRTE